MSDPIPPRGAAYEANVVAYYTECWSRRIREGHNPATRAIHYGLDEPPGADAGEIDGAKARTNDHVIDRLALDADRPIRLLELGSGAGSVATHVALARPRWSILGIDLTPNQVTLARELARVRAVAERVTFTEAHFERFAPDGLYDAAYAVESVCHASNRPELVASLGRCLRRGAPVVFVDLARTDLPLTAPAEALYRRLVEGYAIRDYYDVPIATVLRDAGFEDVTVVDLTTRVGAALSSSAARAARAVDTGSPRASAHRAACAAAADLVASGHLGYLSVRGVWRREHGES